MKGIYGTKIGMTQVFEKNGRLIPVTVLRVDPNQVVGVRSKDKDGYDATLIGFGAIEGKKLSAPARGQFVKRGLQPNRHLREIRGMTGYSVGQTLKVHELFEVGQCVDAQSKTKGHGFTGAIKRWNFKIGPLGHGAGYPHRFQGSVQAGRGGSQAQRVFKGKKMSGRYGHETRTIQNLYVVAFKGEENLVLINGAVPGPNGQTVRLTLSKKHPERKRTFNLVGSFELPKEEPKPAPAAEPAVEKEIIEQADVGAKPVVEAAKSEPKMEQSAPQQSTPAAEPIKAVKPEATVTATPEVKKVVEAAPAEFKVTPVADPTTLISEKVNVKKPGGAGNE